MPRVYKTEVLGTLYKYRGATRAELEEALRCEFQVDIEDSLCRACVVYPDIDLDNCLAGIPTTLARKILEASGMTEEGTELLQEEVEEWIISSSGKLEILMMGVLHLPLDQIRNMDPIDWFKSAGAAQLLAASMYGLDVDKFITMNPFERRSNKKPVPPAPNNPSGRVVPPILVGPGEIPEHKLRQWEEEHSSVISR